MRYDLKQIEKDVRLVLDRNKAADSLLDEETTTLTLNDIIDGRIELAARTVLLNAPLHLIGEGKELPVDVNWESQPGYGMGFIMLPSDYLRLVTFQMTDWESPVTEPITEENPLYARQRSRYPGVRGCPQRPVVAIASYPSGMALEFFSCQGGEKVAVRRARYIAIPQIEEEENNEKTIDLPPKCYDGIVFTTAAMACAVLKDDLAAVISKTANQLLK